MLLINQDEIKLIVSDIDGTLLNDDKFVPQINIDVIKNLSQHNIFFSICSGRMPKGFINIVNELNNSNSIRYIIGANGAAIYDLQQKVYVEYATFSVEDTNLLRTIIEKHNGYYQICGDNDEIMYISDEEKYTERYINRFGKNVDGTKSAQLLTNNNLIKACKFTIFFTNKMDFDKFKINIKNNTDLQVKQVNPLACDIVPNNFTKWTGILFLANLLNKNFNLNITPRNILYFGDELNDLSVFENGVYKIAMKNANPKIKKLSYEICEDNNSGGVGKYIQDHLIR